MSVAGDELGAVADDAAPHGAAEVLERRAHYQNMTHRLLPILLFMSLTLAAMTLAMGFFALRPPTVLNYAVTDDLRVIELTPLREPAVTEAGLLNWVADSVREIYSYDFVHWREQLQAVRGLFVDEAAFEAYVKALVSSGNLDAVRSRRYVVSAVLDEPPNILNSGMLNGRFSWQLEVPVRVRYESANEDTSQELLVKVLVQRVSQVQNARGLGISQIVAPRR